MKKIVFLGAPDKSHLLLVLGKLLVAAGQKVLIVDSTIAQSILGFMPSPDERQASFVTEFEGMDIAAGFLTFGQLDHFLKQTETEGGWANYDVFLLDTDHTEFVKGKDLPSFDQRVWCSNLEKLAMLKNAELMRRLCLTESTIRPLSFFKLVNPFLQSTIAESYIDSHVTTEAVEWQEPVFRIPFDERDVSVRIDHQHHSRIELRKLSPAYRHTVYSMAKHIFGLDERTIKAAWKRARRVFRGS